jgi:hypothetical protein
MENEKFVSKAENNKSKRIIYLVRRVTGDFLLTPGAPRIDKVSFTENRLAATPLREDDDVETLLRECEVDQRFDWHIDRNNDPRGPIIFGLEKGYVLEKTGDGRDVSRFHG